jgi:hypothetical protein
VRAPWVPVDAGPMFHRVRRGRDTLVHVVQGPVPGMVKVNSDGMVISDDDAHFVVTACGVRVKMNAAGRNRYTTSPATCLVCVVGGFAR